MKYRLVLVTHGDAPALDEVLEAFARHVAPRPTELVAVVDGPGSRLPPTDHLGAWQILAHGTQQGFCAATRAGWQLATLPGADYVFWLENDFVIKRDLDLADLASVIDRDRALAQMQLMRNAVNDQEIAAGGLYESRPGQYAICSSFLGGDWLEHSGYVTTNPCLMRRDFMESNPWPHYDSQCEGKFGIDLIRSGYRFAVWGTGDPWCEHVGVRDGIGY